MLGLERLDGHELECLLANFAVVISWLNHGILVESDAKIVFDSGELLVGHCDFALSEQVNLILLNL